MHDPPGGQKQHRRLAGAVALPVDAHAITYDDAGQVGLACRGSGVAPSHLVNRRPHGFASNTRLKGVSAARRKRVNPPAETTSPIRASPACAPSASPTSCESDA